MRDPDKYTWFENQAMRIPPPPPRLPRDHAAMRPHLSRIERAARNGVAIVAIVCSIVWLFLR